MLLHYVFNIPQHSICDTDILMGYPLMWGGILVVVPLKIGCPSHLPSVNSSSARVGFMIHAVNFECLNLVQILPIIMARVNFRSLMIWLFRSQKCLKWYCHLFCVCPYACMQTHMCACTQAKVSLGYCPIGSIYLLFLRQCLSLN